MREPYEIIALRHAVLVLREVVADWRAENAEHDARGEPHRNDLQYYALVSVLGHCRTAMEQRQQELSDTKILPECPGCSTPGCASWDEHDRPCR